MHLQNEGEYFDKRYLELQCVQKKIDFFMNISLQKPRKCPKFESDKQFLNALYLPEASVSEIPLNGEGNFETDFFMTMDETCTVQTAEIKPTEPLYMCIIVVNIAEPDVKVVAKKIWATNAWELLGIFKKAHTWRVLACFSTFQHFFSPF